MTVCDLRALKQKDVRQPWEVIVIELNVIEGAVRFFGSRLVLS
jgi:hypothetical protein